MTQEPVVYKAGRWIRKHRGEMISGAIAIAVASALIYFGSIAGNHEHRVVRTATATADNRTSQSPTENTASNPLCNVISAGRRDLVLFAQRVNAETNPLKKSDAEQAYQQRAKQFTLDVSSFVSQNTITDYVGTVTQLSMQSYNGGPGVILGIDLPCNTAINFQFVTTNPAWGSPDNKFNVAIERWRPVLADIAVGDTVTFSGAFILRYGTVPVSGDTSQKISLEARITDLRKGTRPLASSPAIPALSSEESVRIAERDKTLSTGVVLQMYGKVTIGEGSSKNWQDYVTKIDSLKSALVQRDFQVSGFDHSNAYYYSVVGTLAPPPSAQPWVIGQFTTTYNQGYTVSFLERADTTVASFQVDGDRATGTYRTVFKGCTIFCELWKEVRTLPPDIGQALFVNYNPNYDLDGTETHTINFSWDPQLGWHVVQ